MLYRQGQLKLVVFAFFLLIGCKNLQAASVDEQLKHLSIGEKNCIKNFFATAIRLDQLGHVLFFSNKPACLTGLQLTGRKMPIRNKAFLHGWKVWKKNEHLFSHPNFIFCAEISESDGPEKFFHIYIINKKTTLARLTEFEDCFKEILGEDFSKEIFMEKLEKTKQLSLLINNDDVLRGILLGFDKESTNAFKQRSVGELQKNPDWKKHYQRINCEENGKHLVHPVVFMGDPETEEVKHLKTTYAFELEPIQMIYQKKNLLKLVLQALTTS